MTTVATLLEMESAAACSSVDQNHQPHTANSEEEEYDMRMLQDPPSTTGDEEHDMAPWIKVTGRAIRRKDASQPFHANSQPITAKAGSSTQPPGAQAQTSTPSC
ncbi:hypothetical protein HPB47_024341 [Ixodes persulcatus]|uniref:Uncharacterized protein n=1 Tax=Ixodes persulcatus TaxID=34615 RepID=A0AC60Q4I0_IXOPE|nr:hypothetical protein HPB47_024341 [Ixodes persulcatus]